MSDPYDLEGDVADAILLGYEEGPSPWTRRAAARVLALLREGPRFDEAVERMMPGMSQTVYALALGCVPDKNLLREQAAFLLRAALGEDTE